MIIPMKKAQIVVLKEDKDKLLESLQKSEVLMLVSSSEKELNVDLSFEHETLKRTEESLQVIKEFREKPKFVREEFVVDYDNFVSDNPRRLELLDLIEANNARIGELNLENENLNSEISFYQPWETLNVKLNELDLPKYAVVHTGFVLNHNLDNLCEHITSMGGDYRALSTSARESALIFACFVDDDKELMDYAKTVGFVEVNFDRLEASPAEIIESKKAKINENLKEIEKLTSELKAYSLEADELLVLSDKLASDVELKTAPVEETYSAVYLLGWVRSDQVEKLEKTIKKTTSDYDLEILDPAEDEVVPTATKNNKFVSAFEPITNMFSIPSINDVDPNPVMGFWYWMIFGMMMGDAGYGIMMVFLMRFLIKAMKPKGSTYKMYKMLFYGGFATILWGILFNSYFGYTLGEIVEFVSGMKIEVLFKPIVLNPTVDIVQYLVLSMVIGGLHLISGYLVKAYADMKDGRFVDAILDNFAWIFLLSGLGLIFVPSEILNKVGMALAITAVAMIVLTHGRKSKNIFAKLGGGLYSLYNSVNVFSDILSYSRILALSLSSAIIGMVMNILAEMVGGGKTVIGIFFAIIIYIIGHIFNLVMGLLSAYVHDSRLQYIEFFGKFYEGGGVEFKPLSMSLKHIDKIEKVEI
ncbi:MAG: V-type ATP synthase subunit I [Bacilli bacterium]